MDIHPHALCIYALKNPLCARCDDSETEFTRSECILCNERLRWDNERLNFKHFMLLSPKKKKKKKKGRQHKEMTNQMETTDPIFNS